MVLSFSRRTLVPVPENQDPPDFRRGLEINYTYIVMKAALERSQFHFTIHTGIRNLSKKDSEASNVWIRKAFGRQKPKIERQKIYNKFNLLIKK